MPIVYYPNRVYRAKEPAIDRVMSKMKPVLVSGSQNTASTALDTTISNDKSWQINSIALTFSDTTERTFTASIVNGIKIVEDLNDYLWFQITSSAPQRIILDAGFYTGTELAAELKSKLDANTAFSALSITFTVAYSATTGIFTITPSSGQIKYLNVARQTLPIRDSIAGHLFGLNTTTDFAANVASDTAIYGLNSEIAILTEANNSSTSYFHEYIHTLTLDQAINISSNVGANVTVGYVVNYENIESY